MAGARGQRKSIEGRLATKLGGSYVPQCVYGMALSERALYVASGLTVKKFDTVNSRFIGEYQGHRDYVVDVAVSCGKMATVSDDMTAICTDVDESGNSSGPASLALEGQENYRTIFACKFSKCGQYLYVVLAHVIKKWCMRDLSCVRKFDAPRNSRMINCAPTDCGRYLYVALSSSGIVRFDTTTGDCSGRLPLQYRGVINTIAIGT
ncbi:unnamed protein product [Amoebophrya sp. A25]|nr:unnamed protein product [Amoebophrya sp. A25]|eukprot:GSA25T00026382001.1